MKADEGEFLTGKHESMKYMKKAGEEFLMGLIRLRGLGGRLIF